MYDEQSSVPSRSDMIAQRLDKTAALAYTRSMRLLGSQQLMVPRRTPGLQRLPYEIMAYIVKLLDIDEIFDLSLSCHHFQYLVREESFCKAIITAKAPHTAEAQEAQQSGCYSRALRRVAKRRRAFCQASPYVVGIVGLADSYEYIQGILCYIIENRPKRWLRILDLHGSASCELVIDIPTLIRVAVPRSAKSRKYKFRVLYHANGITSCLFSFALPNTENWLLIFNAEEQCIVAKVQLDSTAKIFVRNNKDYLYFGTHSEEGADGFRKWVLTGFNINDRFWFPQKMHLANLVGYDIGSTVCFEIIDDHFYGLSNQTDFEIRETDWTSYYYCFRFPLQEPDSRKIQTMEKDLSWRRQHAEGPIDDRWGFLKLDKDEASGQINIIESRKEWLAGQSGSRRTYYTTKTAFGTGLEGGDDQETPTAQADLSNAPTRGTIRHLDKPNTITSRFRSPGSVHPGDDSSMTAMFTRSQTLLRSYERCCSAYLDLVDDAPNGSSGYRRLRLRAGCRKLKPVAFSGVCPISNDEPEPDQKAKERYFPNEIYFWPPQLDRPDRNPFLDKIYGIINPPGYCGSVTATGDERSLVYATGEDTNGLKVLVYISFDPAARLSGMLREDYILGERVIPDTQDDTSDRGRYNGTTVLAGDATAECNGKGVANSEHSLPSYISDTPSVDIKIASSSGDASWAYVQKAMHRDLLGKTYTFARGN
ncbi:hypothetical protein GGR54DRAFT_629304 [Hypoxylon sp. NC1633]|nr:hypothetical protein GGR54DRAFT_629304 [Hypoxylon sp. NC1633]